MKNQKQIQSEIKKLKKKRDKTQRELEAREVSEGVEEEFLETQRAMIEALDMEIDELYEQLEQIH
ncbi:hypothetical protein HMF8227_01259 [Saliniradius amylolyticus]|uniref:Uncharacterized protein n=1 Tax=Saliniradius amylolyticus TaxID=2183582 RepID=A0A2S2E404_9ALTE|nr:hypothetical protein [Saliniradius amylolyticus]AWL11737.1 hypothetical protein HMF8227_01259 [Saliniradius amylolyticus]